MILNLPNIMTMGRILVIPFVAGLCFVEDDYARWLACGLFVLAALTDFFDGMIARRWNQVSDFGRFLDPIADKLLVGALLLALAATGDLAGWAILPAIIILCREIFISGLREFLGGKKVIVHVTKLAKWKTTAQLVALGLLIAGPAGPDFVPLAGQVFLALAAVLTVITGYDYFRASFPALGITGTDRGAAAKAAAGSMDGQPS